MDIREEKRVLRAEALKERQSFDPAVKKQQDVAILQHLSDWPILKESPTLALFVGKSEEIQTIPLIELALQSHVVVLPKVSGSKLILHPISSVSDLKPGVFGLLEPTTTVITDPNEVNLFIIPGLLFDQQGYRLGWGKGYYDRLLKNIAAPKVGIIYHSQIRPSLPHGQYDIPVDYLASEKGIQKCSQFITH